MGWTKEQREAQRERLKSKWADPEYREMQRKRRKKSEKKRLASLRSAESREKMSAAQKKSWASGDRKAPDKEEFSRKVSEGTKRAMEDPNVRKKCSEGGKKVWRENREHMLSVRKEQSRGTVYRAKRSQIARELWEDPEYREKVNAHKSKTMKRRWEDPEYRAFIAKMLAETAGVRKKKQAEWIANNPDKIDEIMRKARKAGAVIRYTVPHKTVVAALKKKRLWRGFDIEVEAGPYSIDIADKSRKLAIEIDGCFWHACKECGFRARYACQRTNRRIEKSKTTYLKKRGWTLLRFWEHEVLDDVSGVVARIKDAL